MPGLFFWNLYGRQDRNRARREAAICATLTRLVQHRDLDVLVFAECEIAEAQIASALNAGNRGTYHCPRSRSRRIKVWTRLAAGAVVDRYNGRTTDRFTVRTMTFPAPAPAPVRLVGVHLTDRQTAPTEAGRMGLVGPIVHTISGLERRDGDQRTILIGDLNMNPYEAGVVGTHALHAVMTKELTQTVAGLTARERHSCFYNPMWSCFGDISAGPSGTHYWANAEEPTNHFWQLYDQVLVRPELIASFVRVEILASDGQESLLTRAGRPRSTVLSDHLPLYCEFNFV
ncbi:Endonuclease/exonuclease/phosphatase family protein OS=Bacteroides sp. 3_1_19 GN=HMPREF0104_02709 PE=4 SV=1: Exo_endo_phos [Gemmataceae bacterium]|jgi:endonuclease/exonuclease/phosphatase (EEP) superfamily protein YafD|nr:Endonuclease/exonuclease/phosphatase family protein OS=Bacteroides sp. 3_1_19 GN=HMPREF0104_02709 PE=4 SV=1: Exo_endo_phos [Gemmataceae bacterium]VTU01781.1 Endonuclease/exonuclease/phosphatase family protein OS=Bacteroides sp. 3_1_19 GN=HMPREF0104_02709 PE=4 SV=1: Exo_endo_phos [Gemmataceae bacterium]